MKRFVVHLAAFLLTLVVTGCAAQDVAPTEVPTEAGPNMSATPPLPTSAVALETSTPEPPVQLSEAGSLDGLGSILDVQVAGGYAYLADSFGGMQVVEVRDPARPLPVSAFASPGSSRGQGVFVSEPYVYLADGQGIRILDLTDPATPVELGFYDTLGFALDLQVVDGLAFVAAREGGLSIGDVSDPADPRHLSQLFDAGSVHVLDVRVSGSNAYVAMEEMGLKVVDVSQPADPVEVGSLDMGGMAEAVDLFGATLYLADGEQGVRTIDVSDPSNPEEIGHFDTPGYAQDVTFFNNHLFVADGWSSLLLVLDVKDPADPLMVGQYETEGFVWGVMVSDPFAYLALGERGLLALRTELN